MAPGARPNNAVDSCQKKDDRLVSAVPDPGMEAGTNPPQIMPDNGLSAGKLLRTQNRRLHKTVSDPRIAKPVPEASERIWLSYS